MVRPLLQGRGRTDPDATPLLRCRTRPRPPQQADRRSDPGDGAENRRRAGWMFQRFCGERSNRGDDR